MFECIHKTILICGVGLIATASTVSVADEQSGAPSLPHNLTSALHPLRIVCRARDTGEETAHPIPPTKSTMALERRCPRSADVFVGYGRLSIVNGAPPPLTASPGKADQSGARFDE